MSDNLEYILKILHNNGVSVEQIDIWSENDSIRHKKSVFELDFTEHDKVFEDRITKLIAEKNQCIKDNAKLEKDIESYKKAFEDKNNDYLYLSSFVSKYQSDNESLQKRIAEFERENESLKYSIDKILESRSEWIDKAVEWQQKCEKLENKGNDEFIVEIKVPATPTEIATHLIKNTCTINELEQIAEHLLVYCKHNREGEE